MSVKIYICYCHSSMVFRTLTRWADGRPISNSCSVKRPGEVISYIRLALAVGMDVTYLARP